jgi:hypothetical protein
MFGSSLAFTLLFVLFGSSLAFTSHARKPAFHHGFETRMCGPVVEESTEWQQVLRDLNSAPVFVLTDAAGLPLHQRMRDDGQKLVIFYAEIDRAMDELAAARRKSAELNLQLAPVGLGVAYAEVSKGTALLVPGFQELASAQDMQLAAPAEAAAMLASAGVDSPSLDWPSDVLPVFGCFEMVRRRADGSVFTPVFMSCADAQAALDKARAADPERAANFEVDVVPLPELLKIAVSGEAKVPPRVVPPSSSMLFLQGKGKHHPAL